MRARASLFSDCHGKQATHSGTRTIALRSNGPFEVRSPHTLRREQSTNVWVLPRQRENPTSAKPALSVCILDDELIVGRPNSCLGRLSILSSTAWSCRTPIQV